MINMFMFMEIKEDRKTRIKLKEKKTRGMRTEKKMKVQLNNGLVDFENAHEMRQRPWQPGKNRISDPLLLRL